MFGVRKAASEFVDGLHEVQRETDRLKAENANLRKAAEFEHNQLEDIKRAVGMMLEEHDAMLAENAKLREMVRDMFAEIEASGFDPLVERQGKRGSYYEEDPSWRVGIRERVRELGIEVEDDD